MPDDANLSDDERNLFRQAVVGVQKLSTNDRTPPAKPQPQVVSKRARAAAKRAAGEQAREHASYPFSSQFEPALPEGTMKYTAADANPYLAKQLRRGDFAPELVVDLHGLTQIQAQRDLAAAIIQCRRDQAHCLNVIHGVGTGVLRQRVPGWLMQHSEVLAFHQAPLEWGGQGALLVLLKTDN
ncbi:MULTISPECIES: endonuclease SmrB [Aliidiomarina]|nr:MULTISPECIES: endonuclease SmrB [Aliidiomarina]